MRAERAAEPTKSENITVTLAAFGRVLGPRLGHGGDLRRGRGSASKVTDCTQYLTAITKDDAEVS
jgi:hypothetical protein